MFEGVEVALIHGDAFVHEDFADKVAIVATNNKRAIRGHGPSVRRVHRVCCIAPTFALGWLT